ncbi:MAG TPA: hypothetical protein VFV07_03060 [Rhizomicrobium sp.]|nr:hypothetical protein [Rhizomicrobium sp.]
MPKILVENLSERRIRLDIEPWADEEELAPREKVEFEYEEPAEVVVSFLGTDEPAISISSNVVYISAKGEQRAHRMPAAWRDKPGNK